MSMRTVEVFGTFLKLGLTSFGGPIADPGYLRKGRVERRGWVTESPGNAQDERALLDWVLPCTEGLRGAQIGATINRNKFRGRQR